MALPGWAAGFMAGLAAREFLGAESTADALRQNLRQHLTPRQQAKVEALIARGLEVSIERGKDEIRLFVRDAKGRIRERAWPVGGDHVA
jgi:hypothetical protein